MGSPAVTVIIPMYNKGRCVARAIKSVQAQTFQDFEIVVIDDGSTDDGSVVVTAIGDARIRLIRQENRGPGGARNTGMREARSPLVAFLDADDEYTPEYLECAVKNLSESPECAMCFFGFLLGRERRPVQGDPRLTIERGPWRMPLDAPPEMIHVRLNVFPSLVVARREIFQRYGGFYDNNRCTYGEDTYLWIAVALNHPIFYDPRPLSWVHSEDSELGLGRRELAPPKPALTDPEPLRASCPPEYREVLESFLTYCVWTGALEDARRGHWTAAIKRLKELPPGRIAAFSPATRAGVAIFGIGCWFIRSLPGALAGRRWIRFKLAGSRK